MEATAGLGVIIARDIDKEFGRVPYLTFTDLWQYQCDATAVPPDISCSAASFTLAGKVF
jgi:hypothetical protein